MRREWEEVGMCSKEAEALRVEETQGLGGPELALYGYPCCLAPSSFCFTIAIMAGGGRGGEQALLWSLYASGYGSSVIVSIGLCPSCAKPP